MMRRLVLLMVSSFVAVLALAGLVSAETWTPQEQGALYVNRVYAYRDWQSTGIQLAKGDSFTIRAEGRWTYSPFAGANGPEGHRRYLSPAFYPLPNVGGGALVGRVGEAGRPFYVGRGMGGLAERTGLLYLRIDDDRLGDNVGALTFSITVESPPKK